MFKPFLFLLFLLLFSFSANAQSDSRVVVDQILLQGNDKTKRKVILRELNFDEGDTINLKDLESFFSANRLQILSTGLFNNVALNLKDYNVSERTTNIEIVLEENWYLFPVPIFELADRNFSVWWKEQGRKFSRTNIGFRVGHYNFTGNRDPIKLKVHFGYTSKYELTYVYPYLAWDNKLGLAGSIFYSENREIAYKTEFNKTLFHQMDDERKLLSRMRIGPELKFRPTRNSFHSLRLEFHQNKIDPVVATDLNADYFLGGKESLRFMYAEYDFSYDYRLYSQDPIGGHMIFGNVKKEGWGLFNDYDNLSVQLGFEKHHQLSERIILSTRNKGKTNIIRDQVAFANNTGLGWDSDIVSGYDLYVMDGTDFVITMNNIKFKFFDQNLDLVKWMPKQFQKMNLVAFLRLNMDAAYVNETTYVTTNSLNNRWVYGGGPALDLILFNNFLFSFEYSFNDLGESGLYFQNAITF